jgi:hypothetical protein
LAGVTKLAVHGSTSIAKENGLKPSPSRRSIRMALAVACRFGDCHRLAFEKFTVRQSHCEIAMICSLRDFDHDCLSCSADDAVHRSCASSEGKCEDQSEGPVHGFLHVIEMQGGCERLHPRAFPLSASYL